MTYVILNVSTQKAYRKPGDYCEMTYETERGAKSACTKLNNRTGNTFWTVVEYSAYKAVPVKMVKRINMMSGLEYEEPEDTPCFMSPACESYWSM